MLKNSYDYVSYFQEYSHKPDCNLVRRYKIAHTDTLYIKYTISEMKIHWVSIKGCCYNYQCTIQSINCKPLDHKDVQGHKKKMYNGDQKGMNIFSVIFLNREL